MIRPPPSSTLFPYTTLSRSSALQVHQARVLRVGSPPAEVAAGGEGVATAVFAQCPVPLRSGALPLVLADDQDRKSTRLNSSHLVISYAVFCLKKKTI